MDNDVYGHMGRFSVRCEGGLFTQGELLTAAGGRFVHVYLDRVTRRPSFRGRQDACDPFCRCRPLNQVRGGGGGASVASPHNRPVPKNYRDGRRAS
jgi:hypothetical protein